MVQISNPLIQFVLGQDGSAVFQLIGTEGQEVVIDFTELKSLGNVAMSMSIAYEGLELMPEYGFDWVEKRYLEEYRTEEKLTKDDLNKLLEEDPS